MISLSAPLCLVVRPYLCGGHNKGTVAGHQVGVRPLLLGHEIELSQGRVDSKVGTSPHLYLLYS